MSRKSKWEYFKAIYDRYQQSTRSIRKKILDEFCDVCGYNRKYAIRKLNGPAPSPHRRLKRRPRGYTYSPSVLQVIASVWESAGHPCSLRLKAILARWMPWIQKRFRLSTTEKEQILTISARQIDRRLKPKKAQLRRRRYGRTKPGTLLKHHIPLRCSNEDIQTPGFTEVDTVAHCGNSASGEFAYTVNQTDVLTTWVESRAVLGKGEVGVVTALDEMALELPFTIKGIDSDNGSEFINWHLLRYCQQRDIELARGRPYKRDDNAHIEQKNWTHVRKLLGWDRYDTPQAVEAINDLYRGELRLLMNLFMPSMKLVRKERVGSRLRRVYDEPKTPFERVIASGQGDPEKIATLQELYETLDPFELAQRVDRKLEKIFRMANLPRRMESKRPSEVITRTTPEQRSQTIAMKN